MEPVAWQNLVAHIASSTRVQARLWGPQHIEQVSGLLKLRRHGCSDVECACRGLRGRDCYVPAPKGSAWVQVACISASDGPPYNNRGFLSECIVLFDVCMWVRTLEI